MTKEELEKEAENFIIDRYKLNECYREDNAETREYMRMDVHSQYEEEYQLYLAVAEPREKQIAELEAQIEKLIDFVLSKTECCDVCPMTDTCINSEGTCPYVGILAKGEEEVTREWLIQKITKEIKEK